MNPLALRAAQWGACIGLLAAPAATALAAPATPTAPATSAPSAPSAPSAASALPPPAAELLPAEPGLLLELRLDGVLLADALNAVEAGDDLLLPVGELARLLTLGITVDPVGRSASGFLLREDRGFRLDADGARVQLPGGATEPVDPAAMRWIDGDLYVASRLLQRWWPVDLAVQMSTLTLRVQPRETLPVQARLARARSVQALGPRGRAAGGADAALPLAPADYRLWSLPVVDQTLGLQASRRSGGGHAVDTAWNAHLSGDLLGMEAALFLRSDRSQPRPALRMTLGRHDPDGGLLGPLAATAVTLGHVGLPALANVMGGSGSGEGLLLSNRPTDRPGSDRLHTLRGELPPGWDVTLFFNDALIGLRSARPDGQYVFEDQPLVFGRNEFRLVFNGPLGQTRVERQVFVVDQTLTRPGELHYTAGAQRGAEGGARRLLQLDLGLTDTLAASVGLVGLGGGQAGGDRHFANVGLRSAVAAMLLSLDHTRAGDGGHLSELGLRAALGRFALDLSHTRLKDFHSDLHGGSSDPMRTRTRARIAGALQLGPQLVLPLGLDLAREATLSGRTAFSGQGRLSLNLLGTSVTQSMNWQADSGSRSAGGTLQLSRRVAGVGVSGQFNYLLRPDSRPVSLALSADHGLDARTRVSVGAVRAFETRQTTWSAGYSRNFGSFGMQLSARHAGAGDIGVGLQLFMAVGRHPATSQWLRDWQPMAGSGTVVARAFVDANLNGRHDPDEPVVPGAGFTVNGGSRHPARTDDQGLALIGRLATQAYIDLRLDPATLEDPQWQPLAAGQRVLPRPGHLQVLDFPVVLAGEVDGSVFLHDGDQRRGIGNAELELVAPDGKVAATARSGSDGYYLLPAVRPGRWMLRINPAQLLRLGLTASATHQLSVGGDGDIVHGLDFSVRRQ